MKRQFPWMQTCTVIFVIGDWSITHMQTQFPHLTHSETHMNLASYIINQHRMPYKNKGYELWWLIYLLKSGTRETASTWFTRLDYKSTYTFLYPTTTKNKPLLSVTDNVSANGSDLVQYVNFHNWLTNNISPGCKTACLLIDITLSRNMKVVNKQLHNYQSKDNTLIDWSISSEFV